MFGNVSNRHIGFKDIMILIPISSEYYYIVFYNGAIPPYIKSNKVNVLSIEEVMEINKIIVNNAYVKCVARDQKILELLCDEFKYKSPPIVQIGNISGAVRGSTLKKEVFFFEKDEYSFEFFLSPEWTRFRGLGRNEPCMCGSGKKFKKCCYDKFSGAKRIMDTIEYNKSSESYRVSSNAIMERSIDKFFIEA